MPDKDTMMTMLYHNADLRNQVLSTLFDNAFDGDDEAYGLLNAYAQAMLETGTLDSHDENVYFIGFERANGTQFYSMQFSALEELARYRASCAYHISGHVVVAVYLYHAYCKRCAPDVNVPYSLNDHVHPECDCEPATQFDYIAKFDGEKVNNLP